MHVRDDLESKYFVNVHTRVRQARRQMDGQRSQILTILAPEDADVAGSREQRKIEIVKTPVGRVVIVGSVPADSEAPVFSEVLDRPLDGAGEQADDERRRDRGELERSSGLER